VNPLAAIGRPVRLALREIGRVSVFGARAAMACLTPPFHLSQLGAQFFRLGFLSLPVVGLTAIFIGAALALNIHTGGARVNAESFVPSIVVLGITRELGPVLAGLMVAGRASGAIAAEIGAMKVSEQIDALRTLSADPMRYLTAPRVLAMTLTLPVLVLVADIIGVMGGWLVATQALGFQSHIYLTNTVDFLRAEDVALGLIKATAFGAIIAIMGAYQGFNAQGGALGVGRAATHAVVGAAVLILAANYLITAVLG
jgi:phospholipid/cholesterol/gamma-HCH transport system permease protein